MCWLVGTHRIYKDEVDILKGIDISYWQDFKDVYQFKKAKNDGYKFVILRTSYGRELNKDSRFEHNYKNAIRAGMIIGAYHYSTAKNVAQAQAEAKYVLKILDGRKLDYPVFIDFEDRTQRNLGKALSKKIIEAFCEVIVKGGYRAGVYASYDFLKNRISPIDNNYFVWFAQYPRATYTGRYEMHQYSSTGKVDGFSGGIDVNTSKIKAKSTPVLNTTGKVKKVVKKIKPKKSTKAIAKEVIAGKWGNGNERITRLKASGYNPIKVQKAVNKLMK